MGSSPVIVSRAEGTPDASRSRCRRLPDPSAGDEKATNARWTSSNRWNNSSRTGAALADRKGSSLVPDQAGSLGGFDHGLSCHTDPKLRTVLWGWTGQPLPEGDLARLDTVAGWLSNPKSPLSRTLDRLLPPAEVQALRRRIAGLLGSGVFPRPNSLGPAVPWPPL